MGAFPRAMGMPMRNANAPGHDLSWTLLLGFELATLNAHQRATSTILGHVDLRNTMRSTMSARHRQMAVSLRFTAASLSGMISKGVGAA